MRRRGDAAGRRPAGAGTPSRAALLLAAVSLTSVAPAQQPDTTEPYRFYGGDVDRTAKDTAVEACEYRLLVEEQRCNDAFNKTTCIARIHETCLADPGGSEDDSDSGLIDFSEQSRR